MADHFGISQGVIGATNVYFQSSRRTGRTTSLIESLKDGDRVIFIEGREADRVKKLCRERGVEIHTRVVSAHHPEQVFDRGPSKGRTVFDHSWVEEFFKHNITRLANDIDQWQTESSGDGAPHQETKLAYREAAKWIIE